MISGIFEPYEYNIFLSLLVVGLLKFFYRITFGWFTRESKISKKAWWKRKEYKVPKEYLQVYKRSGQNTIQRYQKNVKYHNSSQFRHWILGGAILIAFITLGTKLDNSYLDRHNEWNASKKECGSMFSKLFPGIFCFTSDDQNVTKIVMSRAMKLLQCLNRLKKLEELKKTSTFDHDKIKVGDATDEEWESVEGRIIY